MLETFKMIGIILALCIGALVVDYCSYFQATIFTTLDDSGKGINETYHSPRYHPLAHPILWILMAIVIIPAFFLVAFNVGGELLAWITALGLGAFLMTRYILMRRGIS